MRDERVQARLQSIADGLVNWLPTVLTYEHVLKTMRDVQTK